MFGDGFIPAHAGKTVGHRLQHQDRRAHPRSRGENICPNGCPAPHRAHPRSRGENGANVNGTSLPTGSSPLTRGKTLHAARDVPNARLIPAHAGKTRRPRRSWRRSWAHPRSRGENGGWDTPISDWRGSSPLTRGKPSSSGLVTTPSGLIPAHAGKTRSAASIRRNSQAHPRSRGENPGNRSRRPPPSGSSPLTRGKPPGVNAAYLDAGLIPAHAGKTRMRTLST